MHRVVFALLVVSSVPTHGENWPRFRGPTGQGISAEKGLPTEWAADRNVKWKVPIPGEGWSSPIVWGDLVVVTSVTEGGSRGHVIAVDRRTGEIRWNRPVFELVPLRKEAKNSYATPTPVTDGKTICAVFGDGSVVALDFTGGVLWTNREVGFYSRHGLGASPVLHEGLLIQPYDGSNRVKEAGQWPKNSDEERLGWQIPWDQGQLVAYDVKTGQRSWTGRRGKSRIAHVTPLVIDVEGKPQVISAAGDAIQGFDPRTGERLWTVYSRGEGVTPSPVYGEGLIFTSSGFEETTLRTVKPGGRGDVTATHIAWVQRKGTPTQPSLLYVAPHLYSITDGGIVHCFDPKSGEIVYAERVGGNHSASPVYADGRIYFLSETGETAVIESGPSFRQLAKNTVGEKCQASIAISQGNLFIRSERHLFCIGQ